MLICSPSPVRHLTSLCWPSRQRLGEDALASSAPRHKQTPHVAELPSFKSPFSLGLIPDHVGICFPKQLNVTVLRRVVFFELLYISAYLALAYVCPGRIGSDRKQLKASSEGYIILFKQRMLWLRWITCLERSEVSNP